MQYVRDINVQAIPSTLFNWHWPNN